MRRSAPLVCIAALALAGCSAAPQEAPPTPTQYDLGDLDPSQIDGNGLWLLSGADAAGEIVDAVEAAGTVAYSGTFTELTAATPETEPAPGRALAIDYRGRPGEYTAKVAAGELSFEVVAAAGRTYLRGNAAYAAQMGIPELEQGFVCAASGEGLAEQWSPLLRPGDLVAALLESSDSVSVPAPPSDAEVLDVVIGGETAPAGIMHVARAGAPLPTAFTAGDHTGDGAFTFSAWGDDQPVTPPTEVVRSCGESD
ncbi:MAG TPA: hypothetical protein VIP50_04645 [Agromyces sp.]